MCRNIRGMDGLWGSFSTMPIRDLLAYCVDRRLEGTLRCESGSFEKSLIIRGGCVLRASSNDPREYLGQFLINHGHISEEQLTLAFETQRQTKVFLGRILVMIGAVDEPTISRMLELKVSETVLSMMGWDHGQFHFARGQAPEFDPAIDVETQLGALLDEAQAREQAWVSIQGLFPHDGLYLEVSPDDIPDSYDHPLDHRIIDLAMQGQTIAEIALSLHATPFKLFERLLALHKVGVLRPLSPESLGRDTSGAAEYLGGEEEEIVDLDVEVEIEERELIPSKLGEEASVTEIVSLAREFLARGKYGEARAIAVQAVELGPQHDGAHAALKEAEMGMLVELRSRYLSRTQVPLVLSSGQELQQRRLTAAERYLLKRFDGKRSLAQVLKVSPIKEIDALKIVEDMVSAGVMRLDRD